MTGIDWLNKHELSGVSIDMPELLMYRKYTHLLGFQWRNNINHPLAGQYLAKTKGRGMEFDEARHYQPGDDVRAIDWRVTARTGKAHTKLFREERDRPIFVLCDLLPSMQFGSQLLFKSVQACHLSALIAWKAKQNGDKIGGLVLSRDTLVEVKPRSRQQAVLHWLNQLIHVQNKALNIQNNDDKDYTHRFEEGCSHLRRVAHPGSLIYIVSDFQHLSKQSLQHLHQLQKHCEIVCCWVNDPIETALPDSISDNMPITDGQSIKRISTSQQKRQYNESVTGFFEQQKKQITQYSMKWLPINSGLPLEFQL